MRVLPVVERELRAIARRPSAYWVRSVSALGAFAALGYVVLIGAVGFTTANQGRDLFGILSWGAFAYCLLAGMRGTSDAVSFEKREGTLGLLFLTDLKGYDVVFGKLVSFSINSIYGMLAIAPLLALAFLIGGTSAPQFITMIVFLLNTLFFSLSVGMLVSTFSQNDRPAMGATFAILFVTVVMPYGIAAAHSYGALEIWEAMEPGFLLTSPAFAFWAITGSTLLRMYSDEIRLSIAFTNLSGWLCLVIASGSIARRAHADAPRGRLVDWLMRVRQQWAYGTAGRRRAIRSALLDRNAFAWLAGRDRLKQRYAWIFLLLLGALWLAGRWKAREITEEWPATLLFLWFLHLFFKIWVGSEVAARFIEDRRSNALELLLTTPLKLREFVAGERLALLLQFGPPLAVIVLLDLFSGLRASDSSDYLLRSPHPMHFFSAGLVHLVFDLYAIQWVAIWRSLHLRGTNRTISQTIFLIVILPALGWFFLWQGSWLARRGGPSAEQVLWTWTVLCVLYDVTLALIAQHAFYRDFREAATRAFDKATPFSWKGWRARKTSTARAAAVFTPMKPRRRLVRRVVVATVILLACAYAAVLMRRHRLEAAAAARIAAVRAGGFPLYPTEAGAWHPSPPANESASVILREASRAITRAGPLRPPVLVEAQAHWYSRARMPTEVKERFASWAAINSQALELLEELPLRQPGGPVTSDRYPMAPLTEDIARILQLKARIQMEDDPRAAAQTIITLVQLARAMEGEEFNAVYGAHRTMLCVNEILERAAAQRDFSADDWRQWKAIIALLNPIGTLRAQLVVERTRGLEALSEPTPVLFQNYGRQMGYPEWLFNVDWAIRRFFGQDRAELVQYLDEMAEDIALSERPFWQIQSGKIRRSWRPPSFTGGTLIAAQLLPAFDWMFNLATETVAYQRILMAACDVEIFRDAHGELPHVGDVSAFMRIDPFTGNTLRYVVREDGYSIYSTGQDRNDDGGVKPSGRQNGDIGFHCGKPPERKSSIKKP